MELAHVKRVYGFYSGIYDFLFKSFFFPRHQKALNSLPIQPNEKILEIGVGTGLSLPLYPRHCNVTGIDVSREMLREAEKKRTKYGLDHVTLKEMDACDLQFEEDTFDYVIAMFVVSVVPDPVKLVKEMIRVTKNSGHMIIVNHFLSPNPIMAKIEEKLCPLFRKIGWRSDLDLNHLIRETSLEVRDNYKLKPFDLWQFVFAVNNK